VLTDSARRRLAPLVFVAAGLGAYAMIDRELPRERDVVIELGDAAADVSDVEVSWVRPRAGAEEAQLTTRWNFEKGKAPSRLKTRARLPDGEWEVEVGVQRYETPGEARWSGVVNLERTPFWKRDNLRNDPVILPVRETLR
jgi:hypothetical protein